MLHPRRKSGGVDDHVRPLSLEKISDPSAGWAIFQTWRIDSQHPSPALSQRVREFADRRKIIRKYISAIEHDDGQGRPFRTRATCASEKSERGRRFRVRRRRQIAIDAAL